MKHQELTSSMFFIHDFMDDQHLN